MPKAVRDLLQSELTYDEPDRMPEKISITNLDLFMYCVAIVGHFVDLGFDINVAVRYAVARQMVIFGWTLVFILLPAFVNTLVSIRMYSQDKQQNSLSNEFSKRRWLRIVVLVLQMAPILRFADAFIYALKCRRAERKQDPTSQRQYYALMLKEDSDAALLRIFECFLEAAPQLVLQVSLLLRGDYQFTVHQILSITSSLASMGWCLAAYQRALRFAQEDKLNMSWLGSAMQTAWHYLLSMSRVISLSLMAYLFPHWTVLACVIHILIMTAWIQIFEHPIFCVRKIAELAFALALGAVYLFTYILAVEGRTRYRYAIYYSICFCQNVVCGAIWYIYAGNEDRQSGHFTPLLVLTVVPYVIGLVIMVLYYSFFHPKLRKGVVRETDIAVTFKSEQAEVK
ncbi:XK-related protein 6 [Ostrinia nubilalis]|uniref:XK-related protein 6 n=1 Tax=Ostrinia nubilalis TaxID=29057 RepID=UPI003082677A